MKKLVNPSLDKVYIVVEYVNRVFYLVAVYSTKKAAQAHARYLKKQHPMANFKYKVEEHDVYIAHIPDEKMDKIKIDKDADLW